MQIAIAQRVDAAAVLLLVKALALADIDHPRGSALFTPVIIPVDHAWIMPGGALAAVVDLLHVLPA